MLPMVRADPVLLKCGDRSASTPPDSPPPEQHVDDIFVSIFDIDVAFQRFESCDLQLGDTWRGMQSKMSVTAPVKKIRKKSDSKPKSQLNKCNNEKRRRELENETINQLEELLGKCLAEVKQPDKNGIVREATRQIQGVLRQRRLCPDDCPTRRDSPHSPYSPLQLEDVTSTQTQLDRYLEITTLVQALKYYAADLGWVLVELTCDGEIQCVTDNIQGLFGFDKVELHKKSIFSILHPHDHPKLKTILKDIQSFCSGEGDIKRFQGIEVRLLVKIANGTDSTGVVEALIQCGGVRGPVGDPEAHVMCVIRRAPPAPPAPPHRPPAIPANPADHIVFRLDKDFNVLSCDLSGVENCVNISLVGTRYLDLIEPSARHRIAKHLQEAACQPAPVAISEPFRLRVTSDKPWIRVCAKSRLFKAKPSSGEPNFIMSTHMILSDEDTSPGSSEGAVGGPLMTSVVNGEPSTSDTRYRDSISPTNSFIMSDFDMDPWPGTFHHMSDMADDKDKLDSVSSGPLTPLTPRTPATPGDPAAPPPPQPPQPPQLPQLPQPEENNKLRALLVNKGPATPAPPSNQILKDLLKQEDEEANCSDTSAPTTPNTGPHTAPHTPLTPHTPHQPPLPVHHHHSDMLLRILNDKDNEDNDENRRNSSESRMGQSSALLSQLLASNGPASNGRVQEPSSSQSPSDMERYALKRKMQEPNAAHNNAKRATPESQQVSSSAGPATCSTSTTSPSGGGGMSELCQRNQILVSLLARQQTSPTTPLPLPNPALRPPRPPRPAHPAHPANRHPAPASSLSNMLTQHSSTPRVTSVNGVSGVGVGVGGESHLQMVLVGEPRHYAPPAHPPHPPHPPHPHTHYTPQNSMAAYHPPPNGGSNSGGGGGGGSDQVLSDLLDEVIDVMPDRAATDLVLESSRQLRADYSGMKEENAMINAIRQNLMQCERITNSPVPTSTNPPPVYPGQNTVTSVGVRGEEVARARALAERQRLRLLGLQRNQQLLVSPEATESSQSDLGSTINALVSETPPNVSLTRTDYHHMYHSNQMGTNYGGNKMQNTQPTTMLTRQISSGGVGGVSYGGGGGGGGGAATLHTPLSPAPPYVRPPRPALQHPPLTNHNHHNIVGGYFEESGAYCGEYRRVPRPAAAAPPAPPAPSAPSGVSSGGGGGGGGTSEYVRNELRAVVGARSSRPDLHPQLHHEFDSLLGFDMQSPQGGASDGDGPATSWDAATSSSITEAASAAAVEAGGDETAASAARASRASLLQKLLSQ